MSEGQVSPSSEIDGGDESNQKVRNVNFDYYLHAF